MKLLTRTLTLTLLLSSCSQEKVETTNRRTKAGDADMIGIEPTDAITDPDTLPNETKLNPKPTPTPNPDLDDEPLPLAFELTTPATDIPQGTVVSFDWSKVQDGAAYTVSLHSAATCNALLMTLAADITAPTLTVSDLAIGTYYLCVSADASGEKVTATGSGRRLRVYSEKSPVEIAAAVKLSDTGFYIDAVNLEVAPGFRRYEPRFPLWSDGAEKRRFLYLPRASKINNSDMDNWVFPVGTILVKEFAKGCAGDLSSFKHKPRDEPVEFAFFNYFPSGNP